MATVDIKSTRIITLEFRQEKGDDDYGSCMWARFLFDLDNYDLHINSDCGNYAYGWCPTPDKESFLKLMSRINESYLLEKISSRSVVDSDSTWENIKEYINDVLDGEAPDFELDDVKNCCHHRTVDEVYNALCDELKYTNADNENAEDYAIFECIDTTFPNGAMKIVSVFKNSIQPKIKELLKSEVNAE